MSNFVKINISVNKDLLEKIDEKAKSLSVSRSAYIAFSCSQNLKADELLQAMPEFIDIVSQTRDEIKQFNSNRSESKVISKGKRNI